MLLLTDVNPPPTTTLPSACNASALTMLFAPTEVANVRSSVPSARTRARLPRSVALTESNWPANKTAPSDCTATERSEPLLPR